MADPLDGIARWLTAKGLVAYDPEGPTGDTFLWRMPPEPDQAVGLWLYDGPANTWNDSETPRLQVRVRGTTDPTVAYNRVQAIYAALNGLAGVALADGTWLVLCAAVATPGPMGPDANSRHEFVVNFDLDITAPTEHRT